MEVYDIIPDIWNVILSKVDNMLDIINIYEVFDGSKIILNSSSFWINRFKEDGYYIINPRDNFYEWVTEYNYSQNAYNNYITVKTKFDNKDLSIYESSSNNSYIDFIIMDLKNIINHNIDVPNFTTIELNKIYNIIFLTKIPGIFEKVNLKSFLIIRVKITPNKVPLTAEIFISSRWEKDIFGKQVNIVPNSYNIYKSFDISFDEITLLFYKLAYYNIMVTDTDGFVEVFWYKR
jgi:hypothetical protein